MVKKKPSKICKRFVLWTPRVLGLLYTAFFSLFALDMFDGQSAISLQIIGFIIHMVPFFAVLAFTLIGWKKPQFASFMFLGMALFVTFFFNAYREIIGFFLIAFPLFLIAGLFFLTDYWKLVK